jgi:uncharacterized membrane protein YfcA
LTAAYILIALSAFLVGLSKGGLGGALGSLVTPMLALVFPAPVAVGLTLPLLFVGDWFAVGAHWKGWDWKILVAVLPGTIVGVIIGSLVLGNISAATLQHGLGIVALVYVVYKLWERRYRQNVTYHVSPLVSQLFGLGTGFASTLANAGGPIFTIYLLLLKLTPSVFVGTSALYYFILNAIKIPGYISQGILTLDSLFLVAWAIPVIPFGVWSGILLDKRLDMKTFETLILIFLAITGVALLLK